MKLPKVAKFYRRLYGVRHELIAVDGSFLEMIPV